MPSSEKSKKTLSDQVAIVTGGSRGIGRGIVEVLAEKGAKVIVAARAKDKLVETVHAIQEKGGIAWGVQADVTQEDDVQKLIETTLNQFGSIDILINNAGSFQSIGPLWEAETETWWHDVETNLKGVFLCCRHAIPEMIKRKKVSS